MKRHNPSAKQTSNILLSTTFDNSSCGPGDELLSRASKEIDMMLSKTLLDLARPFLRHSPRFTGVVYNLLGGHCKGGGWSRYGRRESRGTEHGYRMVLDLGDSVQRSCYYHGRFYDLANQRLIRRLLSGGDTYIDVGANIGMMTLAAARVVGLTGLVLSFEPNPKARAHLEEHVRLNALAQVQVVNKGLSYERGQLTLRLPLESSQCGTLRAVNGKTFGEFQVDVTLLDDYLAQIPANRRVLLKIDTEGFDFNVLQGGRKLLSRDNVFVVVEVNDAWLREMGQSAEAMFSYMQELGYDAYFANMRLRGLSQQLEIRPASLPGLHHWNALFARRMDAKAADIQ